MLATKTSLDQGLRSNASYALVAILVLIGLALHTWYLPQLPEKIAMHFGADGQPNQWMSKWSGTLLLCCVQVGLPILFLGIGIIIKKLPASTINIPNREYWLHPDRRATTLGHVSKMLAWITVLVSLEMIGIVHLTFLSNRDGKPLNMYWFFTILVFFLAGVFGIAGRSMWRFRLPMSKIDSSTS